MAHELGLSLVALLEQPKERQSARMMARQMARLMAKRSGDVWVPQMAASSALPLDVLSA